MRKRERISLSVDGDRRRGRQRGREENEENSKSRNKVRKGWNKGNLSPRIPRIPASPVASRPFYSQGFPLNEERLVLVTTLGKQGSGET